MIDLNKVKTIVLLMFENRSFDHMLGHLSLEQLKQDVEGLQYPIKTDKYANLYKTAKYYPFNIPTDRTLDFDLPHEFDAVKTQLAKSGVTGRLMMNGFVKAYADSTSLFPNDDCAPMGYFNSDQVPITSFLARQFCVCDHWFSALPSSTQPNRTIAFSGESEIHSTHSGLVPISDNNIFDWMVNNGIKWNVYHDGLSFYALYFKLWNHVLGLNFKDYEFLFNDLASDPGDDDPPQVIIVEPSYQDAPHIGSDRPNDNHAPLAIGWGEEFLRRTYQAVIANQKRWESTVFIVYYDEHGGFYDHVSPPLLNFATSANPPHTFASLGPRIPGIIISPFVKPDSVFSQTLDHTSVLQFLAEKFTPDVPYSNSVRVRSEQPTKIHSISEALTNEDVWDPPSPPSQEIRVATVLGKSIITEPEEGTMAKTFEDAANAMIAQKPDDVKEKYPELLLWQDAVKKSR